MVYKRFSIIVAGRIVVLAITIFLFFALVRKISFDVTVVIVFILILYQIYSLISYVKITNRELARFFSSIKYSDFTQSFKTNLTGTGFEELSNSFTEVINDFKSTRKEKEENFRYLQTIIQHINVGILAYTLDGNIELINNATKKLLRIQALRNISELETKSKKLVDALKKVRAGEKVLIKVEDNHELLQIAIYGAEFKMRDKHIILVSLNNIQSELEEKEMEAWQNLIRVLTHEIMNSITPIVSLSATVNNMLEDTGEALSEDSVDDIKNALNTIEKRSKGLIHFVDDYRNLNRVPAPNFQIFKISNLFERINSLMHEQIASKKISFVHNVDPFNLEITADPDLIEQVLINLILNSMNTKYNNAEPLIKLLGKLDNKGYTVIQVIDNGNGIPEELHDKIFIPFFTTRQEGSGIGLSLSKQIMRAHKGGISVTSVPDKETIFTLRF